MLPDIIRIALRLILVLALIALLTPFQFLIITLRLPGSHFLPQLFHKGVLKIIGARVRLSGPLPEPGRGPRMTLGQEPCCENWAGPQTWALGSWALVLKTLPENLSCFGPMEP